jgi:hypothetical protein
MYTLHKKVGENMKETEQRKQELIIRIHQLSNILGNLTNTNLTIPNIKKLELEYKELLEEFKKLPPEQKIIESDVHEEVSYVGLNYSVRNGWIYSGQEAIAKVISIDNDIIEAKRLFVNSETKGQPVEYVYKLHIVPKKEEKSKPIKKIKPCTKIEEGLSAAKTPDDEYFESMGLVKDKETKQWRRPTPQEYAEFSKKVAEKKKGIVQRIKQ